MRCNIIKRDVFTFDEMVAIGRTLKRIYRTREQAA